MSSRRGPQRRVAVASELDWPIRPHYDVIAGVQDYADSQEDWLVEVSRYPEVRMEEGIRFDGIVGRIEPDTLAAAREAGIPVVNVWISSPVVDEVSNVHVDLVAAGRMAAEHLIARGLRRLVTVGLRGRVTTKRYAAGVAAVAKQEKISCSHYVVPTGYEENRRNWRKTLGILKKALAKWEPPIGLAAHHDQTARVLVTILQDLGWRVPEECAMVATGNDAMVCAAVQPSLSSIDLGYHRNGYDAAGMLDQLMRGKTAPTEPVLVPPKELVVRATSDVFSVRDPEVQRALRFMADNSHCSIGVPDIAAATGLSRQVLERRFRVHLDTSINNELMRLRVERLKRLLVESDTRIKKLGRQAGFGTPANMFQVFKARVGTTPAAYRAEHADQKRW
jgi:LacI family transcriptional regulator